jgi:hypothetical protein
MTMATTRSERDTAGPQHGPGHYSPDGRQWFDDAGQRWLPVRDEQDEFVVELEDVNAASRWASALATLGSQFGNAYSRFVGHATSSDPRWPEYRITSSAFPRVRGLPDGMTPKEAWAPGMAERPRLDWP